MDAAPKQVMQNHLEGALQHFVELLSPTRRSNSVSAHSVTSMLKVTAHEALSHSLMQTIHCNILGW